MYGSSLLHIIFLSFYSIYIICNIIDIVWRHMREDVAGPLPSLKKNYYILLILSCIMLFLQGYHWERIFQETFKLPISPFYLVFARFELLFDLDINVQLPPSTRHFKRGTIFATFVNLSRRFSFIAVFIYIKK